MSEQKILTIERAKWRRGGNSHDMVVKFGGTRLLNDAGFMCCLGFDALACGLTRDQIAGKIFPSSLASRGLVDSESDYGRTRVKRNDNYPDLWDETEIVQRAMGHNDDPVLAEEDREALVRADLIELGWDDVVFV